MLAAGTAESECEIAFPFVDVVGQKEEKQIGDAVEKLTRLRKADDVILNLGVLPGQVPELRNEVRVRQKTHIENQIGVERNPFLVSKADRGDEQALAVIFANELVLNVSAELVDVEFGRIDDDICDVANRLQQPPFFLQSAASPALRGPMDVGGAFPNSGRAARPW